MENNKKTIGNSENGERSREKRGGLKRVVSNQRNRKQETVKLKVIPLGGLNEIGKNMTAFEYGGDILVVDCGLKFPDDEMYGVDIVIPDFSYLEENAKKIRGVFITHGHEDHIGAVPYLLKKMSVPIYGTAFPLGLIRSKLEEHGIKGTLKPVEVGSKTRLGAFKVEAIRTTHSIADSICLCIETPVGRVFHTGDFKVDFTPVDGEPIDLGKLGEIGGKGVTLLLSDSTNASRKGYTRSEKTVGAALENIFRHSTSRIIVATFSSNVHRIQKIIDNGEKFGRKVAISGRSMVNVVSIATELGYLNVPKGILVDLNRTRNIPDEKLIIITTGSQGEPMSALARMANAEHRNIEIKEGDQVILSSSAIPGNEKLVSNVVNKLTEKGAKVIYSDIAETHASGHACEEELKIIQSLLKPKYFMPVHGEYRHLKAHSNIAEDMGKNGKDIYILENGDCLEIDKKSAVHKKSVVETGGIMVDGLGVGDVGNIVLRDRKNLSSAGLMTVVMIMDKSKGILIGGPDIVSRGFVYVRENEDLIAESKEIVSKVIDRFAKTKNRDWGALKSCVRDDLRKFIYNKTERNPVILPIIMEV